ncbi:MAG: alanyl-tRNA editing protein [Chloroflexi bacterium]|nr:alanyl-tRNA editing protein [Chloroflexota bacterium]
MTDLLYQTDSYAKEFDAVVKGIEGNGVLLDRTAFYPGGGGQPLDLGWLAYNGQSVPIVKSRKQGDDIWHEMTARGEPPVLGDLVHGRLDWERRYQLMRTHTAMHILCGVIWRDYGAQVTGGNMEPGKGRMDFEFERMQKELVQEIETRINAEMAAARPILVKILPREAAFAIPDLIRTKINLLPEGISQVRTVEIVGLDLQADGGTHVANTREVGALKLTGYESKGKINKRIYLEVGA